jgi:hypothetical protein
MALEPNDIDITGFGQRPYALLLDVARPLSEGGIPRWALSGVKWVPLGCDGLTVTTDGCDVTLDKELGGFEDQVEQLPFLMLASIACSTLGSDPAYMDKIITDRLTVFASAAFATELMVGTNGGPLSFAGAEKLASGNARTLRLAFADLETWLALQLHGAQGIIHLTPAAMALAAADGLVMFIDGRWVTATGHLVVADAGYTGPAPTDGSVSADQDWLYASGPIFYDITPVKPVGERNFQSTNIARNIHEFFSERYGLILFDPCAVGAVRATLA